MNTNNILIVGGAGYLGSHIAYLLYTLGYAITVLDSLQHQQSTAALTPFAHVVVGDMGDVALVHKILTERRIDAVVHCAGRTGSTESVRDPGAFYHANVTKTQVLLDTMRACGVTQLVYASSCAVYGMPKDIPVAESTPFAPLSPYAKTKVTVEHVLDDYAAAYGMRYVGLRLPTLAGALPEVGLGPHTVPENNLVHEVLHALQHNAPIAVPEGDAACEYLHVHDAAFVCAKALAHLATQKVSDVFNVGTGQQVSAAQVIAAAEQVARKKAIIDWVNRRPGDSPRVVLDSSRAHRLLQWQAEYSAIEYVVQSAWRWDMMRYAR